MSVTYELWDFESGNLVGAYTSESAALVAVLSSAREYGPESVDSLLLAREERSGRTTKVASGSALLAYARSNRSATELSAGA